MSIIHGIVYGTDEDDLLSAGPDFRTVHGQAGNDEIWSALRGQSTLFGGIGNDTLFALGSRNALWGGDGDDILRAVNTDGERFGRFDNYLNGGRGNDRLFGDVFQTTFDGGEGDDVLVAGTGGAVFVASGGRDLVDGRSAPAWANTYDAKQFLGDVWHHSVWVDLNAGYAEPIASHSPLFPGTSFAFDEAARLANRDTVLGVGEVVGTQYDDVLIGGDERAILSAGDGDDVIQITGRARVFGGDGDDSIISTAVETGDGRLPRMFGGHGEDRLSGGDAGEFLEGGEDNDWIEGGAGSDILIGGRGADVLVSGPGYDPLGIGINEETRAHFTVDELYFPAFFDVFLFRSAADSLASAPDRIMAGGDEIYAGASDAFENPGAELGDLIDLRQIPANLFEPGHNAFVFGSTEAGGLMLVDVRSEIDDSTFATHVNLNMDGDETPEMVIIIEDGDRASAEDYSAEDFLL